jgi:hypothetical protein
MLGKALWTMLRLIVETGAVALVLWAVARAVHVRKRHWMRVGLCALLMCVVSLVLANVAALLPAGTRLLAATLTAAFWFPIIEGAFDTTSIKAAAILAAGFLVYPGWAFAAI